MPIFTGLDILSLPDQATGRFNPPFSTLIVGTAPDGVLGQNRYFNDPKTVNVAYGGMQVVRINPSPEDSSFTFPTEISPDTFGFQNLNPYLYDFSGSGGAPQRYPYLGNLIFGTSRPIQISFDPIGYSESVQPASGGLFFECASTYTDEARTAFSQGLGLSSSDLRTPLISFLQEVPDDDYRVAACRVGVSWLPEAPAQVSIPVTGTATAVTNTMVFACLGIGDGSSYDRYLQTKIILTPSALIVDPGIDGLPARYRVYSYSKYSSWRLLLSQINQDSYLGITNVQVLDQGTGNAFLSLNPTQTFNPADSDQTFTVSYSSSPGTLPDLTAASGWLSVLTQEMPDIADFGFISLAGLTGRALTQDPTSAAAILDLLDTSYNGVSFQTNPILVLPWDFVPGGSLIQGFPGYTPDLDASACEALASSLGSERSSRLLLFWGTAHQDGLPDLYVSSGSTTATQVPIAYAGISAYLREAVTNFAGSPGKPTLVSVIDSGYPSFLVSIPPSGTVLATGYPSPDDLDTLLKAGIPPLTKTVSDRWSFHSPVTFVDGSSLQANLAILVIESLIEKYLGEYLGQPNNATTRASITSDLDSLINDFTSNYPAAGIVANVSLYLQVAPEINISTMSQINILGTVRLYNELGQISFQAQLSL